MYQEKRKTFVFGTFINMNIWINFCINDFRLFVVLFKCFIMLNFNWNSVFIEYSISRHVCIMTDLDCYCTHIWFSIFVIDTAHSDQSSLYSLPQVITVNILKFRTLIACQNGLDKRRPRSDCFWSSSLIRILPICYSDKRFANSSPENQHFISEWKEKSVRNFRTFTVVYF